MWQRGIQSGLKFSNISYRTCSLQCLILKLKWSHKSSRRKKSQETRIFHYFRLSTFPPKVSVFPTQHTCLQSVKMEGISIRFTNGKHYLSDQTFKVCYIWYVKLFPKSVAFYPKSRKQTRIVKKKKYLSSSTIDFKQRYLY